MVELARIMAEMEIQGIIGPANGSKPREVLVSSLDELGDNGEATRLSCSSVFSE